MLCRPSQCMPPSSRRSLVLVVRRAACAGSSSAQPLTDLSAMLRERTDPLTGEVLLTMDQVRDIVRRAVDEKERSLREQYDRILQQKLQEQFASFSKFNEDYISRQLKPTCGDPA